MESLRSFPSPRITTLQVAFEHIAPPGAVKFVAAPAGVVRCLHDGLGFNPPATKIRDMLREAGYPGRKVGFDAVRTVASRIKRQSNMRTGDINAAFRAFLPLLYGGGEEQDTSGGTVLSRAQLEHVLRSCGDHLEEGDLQKLLDTVPFSADGNTQVIAMVAKIMALDK